MSSKYELIKRGSVKDLVTRVNKYLKEGWKCQGGVCSDTYVVETSRSISVCKNYYQAMFLEVSDE